MPVSIAPPRRGFGVWEWLWRGRALADARTSISAPTTLEREHLQRARLAAELADRALDPVDPLRALIPMFDVG